MRSRELKKKSLRFFGLLLMGYCLAASLLFAAQPSDLEEQTRQIASELRCPVCQNLSAADSPSELAQEMRQLILEQLKQGKKPEEIKAYFVSKYGEWVLLSPSAKGFGIVLWTLPYVAAGAGILLVLFLIRRWSKKKRSQSPPAQTRTALLEDRRRISSELEELDFDFHSGRLSEADYTELRRDLDERARSVGEKLDLLPAPSPAESKRSEPRTADARPKTPATSPRAPRRNWHLVAGGLFLLLFGIALGVFLAKSIRPRGSEQDTLTGDFLTGTGSGGLSGDSGNNLDSLLAQGRSAFERQDWPQAIEAFKKVLAIDPNQPDAHSYMGMILAQAGHADGALMAFDRALASDPNFPMALWGKGMVLYRAKQDFAGARQNFEKLVSLMPVGAERDEIQKTIAQLTQQGDTGSAAAGKAATASGRIQGVVSVDPKMKGKVDGQAVLFIIARAAGASGGPPLAVQRIDHPKFPVTYSLGPENVMIPGTNFSGEVMISARLDKDGNPTTREPGNVTGEYKKNPVAVGSRQVDIVLDRPL